MTVKQLIENLTSCLDGAEDRLVFIENDTGLVTSLTDCFLSDDGVVIVSSVHQE